MNAPAVPVLPTTTPPAWFNATMRLLLRTPGVRSVLGRAGFALLLVTGRRSHRRLAIPVNVMRERGEAVVLTKRARTWWRNLADIPYVELHLGSTVHHHRARVSVGDPADLDTVVRHLERDPRAARPYGLELDAKGRVDRDAVRALLPALVVVRIPLD